MFPTMKEHLSGFNAELDCVIFINSGLHTNYSWVYKIILCIIV